MLKDDKKDRELRANPMEQKLVDKTRNHSVVKQDIFIKCKLYV